MENTNINNSSAQADKVVKIYSTPTCHYCEMAKLFFDDNDVKYENYDVSVDAERRQEMIEKTGQMGVPVIDIDGEVVVGFDQVKIASILGI